MKREQWPPLYLRCLLIMATQKIYKGEKNMDNSSIFLDMNDANFPI